MLIVISGGDVAQAKELETSLREFGLDWKIECVPVTDADRIQSLSPDVFVAEVHPHSPALLARLRTDCPDTVRLLLLESGQCADALSALDSAHRVLTRPLDAGELVDAVESVTDLRSLLDNEELKLTIGRIDSLPPAPRMYIELVRLMRNPDVSMAEIAYVLSQDPALAAKVLRLCNSAMFSAGREITDIRSAVTRLGLGTLRQLVLASETFGQAEGETGVDRESMQTRALAISRLAGKLLAGPSADLAVTAGLLAEVGLLLPGIVDHLATDTDETSPEIAPGSPGYAEAGAYLLGLWGLPTPIVEAVAHQFRPRRMRSTGFWVTGAVHVASALVKGIPVDESYLHSVGMLDKLPQWRAMAEQMDQGLKAA